MVSKFGGGHHFSAHNNNTLDRHTHTHTQNIKTNTHFCTSTLLPTHPFTYFELEGHSTALQIVVSSENAKLDTCVCPHNNLALPQILSYELKDINITDLQSFSRDHNTMTE